MTQCFLSGVQCEISDAFVLNRREARDLLDRLKDRVASLERVVQQLSPLDVVAQYEFSPRAKHGKFAPKKHRLVCKAVSEAMAQAFPEIKLFLPWKQYVQQSRKTRLQGLRDHPDLGKVAKGVDDNVLLDAEKKGKRVLYLLDGQRLLAPNTRQAIALGTTIRLRALSAIDIATLICTTATTNGDCVSLGLTPAQLAEVRALPRVVQMSAKPEQAPKGGAVKS
jgi:hypothetical protein